VLDRLLDDHPADHPRAVEQWPRPLADVLGARAQAHLPRRARELGDAQAGRLDRTHPGRHTQRARARGAGRAQLGCATVAHLAREATPSELAKIKGALLVAPSDVESPKYPPGTDGFVPMPLERLPFKATVVISSDDEWVSPERARQFASAWGARIVEVGAKGHLNSASKLGSWPEGQALLRDLGLD